ncbi:trichoplein keratin filament-binding protein isoform X1 [Corvus cornix cornix]|uniref:trichoplein keratin filament-binding protein isoform X1 n=1 Tax=Corvus cornix cornix TaxID=932674 RepID=UPI00194F0429|nr:trichoplein keratin filament-binding protein isoform X1 [Corvus cornix cornix]
MSLWLRWGRGPERRAAERRELEARSRQQWESTSRAFARAAACCSLQARWSEPRVPPPRYGRGPVGSRGAAGVPLTAGVCGSAAAARKDAEEKAARLQRRRERLQRLLGEEQEALAAELRERRRGGMRSQELRDGPGECRTKFAEPLLHEHWNKNAELREVESELHRKHVREAWGDQLTQKTKEEVTELKEKKRYENEYETARGEAPERMRQEEEKRQLEEKQQVETLLQQIEELKLQETKATKLKKEQENLLKQQWELENLEEERKQMEEHRRKKELGRFLRHQCDVQLRRRAQQIQEELETDRQILSALLEKEDEDQRRQIAQQERAVADVAWMKRVIEEQLQLEKEREAELETIFREEAKKMWEKREEEWEREKKARDRLMNEVLAGRQRQIQEKMELNRRAQEESIKYREQLIKELEEAKKEGTRREKEQEEELQRARRRELQAQGTERSSREEEEEQEGWARQHREQGWHSRFYSYPRAAWT